MRAGHALLAVAVSTALVAGALDPPAANPPPEFVQDRLQAYCHPPGAGYNTTKDGLRPPSDATLPESWARGWARAARRVLPASEEAGAAFRLRFLQGVLRHGDRSGMEDIPFTDAGSWDCGVPREDRHAWAVLDGFRAQYESPECVIDPPLRREGGMPGLSKHAAQAEVSAATADAVPAAPVRDGCGAEAIGKVRAPGPASAGLDGSRYAPGTVCASGQLTHRGMQQHMRLGMLFRTLLTSEGATWRVQPLHAPPEAGSLPASAPPPRMAAAAVGDDAGRGDTDGVQVAPASVRREGAPLLTPEAAADPWAVRVSSTNYGRTALSGASFWHGLAPLPSVAELPFGTESEPTFQRVPAPAAAAGQPATRSVLVVPREMDPLLAAKDASRCPLASLIVDEVRAHASIHKRVSPRVSKAVAALASAGGAPPEEQGRAARMRTLAVADLVNTRVCHGQPLPCALGAGGKPRPPQDRASEPDGSGVCLSAAVATAVLREADRDYGRRLGGPDVALLMFPALRGIAAQLRAAWEGTTSLRASFRFAHDTVLYPLLASLGAGDHEWPGYASRLTFELWTLSADSELVAGTRREGSQPVHHGVAETLPLVRVVFQGEDITPLLGCSRSWGSPGAAATATLQGAPPRERLLAMAWEALAGSACTLDSFEDQVRSIIHPHSTWADACTFGPARPLSADSHAPPLTTDADGGGSGAAGPF